MSYLCMEHINIHINMCVFLLVRSILLHIFLSEKLHCLPKSCQRAWDGKKLINAGIMLKRWIKEWKPIGQWLIERNEERARLKQRDQTDILCPAGGRMKTQAVTSGFVTPQHTPASPPTAQDKVMSRVESCHWGLRAPVTGPSEALWLLYVLGVSVVLTCVLKPSVLLWSLLSGLQRVQGKQNDRKSIFTQCRPEPVWRSVWFVRFFVWLDSQGFVVWTQLCLQQILTRSAQLWPIWLI